MAIYLPPSGANIVDRATGSTITTADGKTYYDLGPETGLGGNQYGPNIGAPIDPQGKTLAQLNTQSQGATLPTQDLFGNQLSGSDLQVQQGALQGSLQGAAGGTTGTSTGTTGLTNPSSTNLSNEPGSISGLEQQVASNLGMSPEQQTLNAQSTALDAQMKALNQAQGQANLNIEAQPINLGFVTGQEAAIEKSAALARGGIQGEQQTLQMKLANEQAKQQSALDVSKFQLERADIKAGNAAELAERQRQEQVAAGVASVKAQVDAEAKKTAAEVAADVALTKKTTKEEEAKTETPATTTTLAGLKTGKTYVSGTLKYTAQSYSEDIALLTNPNATDARGNPNMGPDGYVNPQVYLTLYKNWTAGGGLTADFLKVYPMDNFINPKNNWADIVSLRNYGKAQKVITSSSTSFTSTEQKKLEQAGLQNASRQARLDFLYGKKSSSTSSSIENMTAEEFAAFLKS